MTSLMPNYARSDLTIVAGEGVYLTDSRGRRYLDFCSGIGVNALGHGHPALLEALSSQARTLWHCSNVYHVPGQERVADLLAAHTFADGVFFCNSGAEAMEGVLKAVRRYFWANGQPERYRVIVPSNSFHGRTLATISAGGQQKYLDGFLPSLDGFDHVPLGDLRAARDAIGPQTAAILLEPIQGESGVHPAGDEYLRGLRHLADEHGLLLALDEVQTGVGRTGMFLAHEWAGMSPDVVGLAKGLGGGFPVGAVLTTRRVAECMTPGTHGSTFGGNPLAMAVVEAVLGEVLRDGFLDGVRAVGDFLGRELRRLAAQFPTVLGECRGRGLMYGVSCRLPNRTVIQALAEEGVLAVGAGGNTIRFLPPLIIARSHVDELVDALRCACMRCA